MDKKLRNGTLQKVRKIGEVGPLTAECPRCGRVIFRRRTASENSCYNFDLVLDSATSCDLCRTTSWDEIWRSWHNFIYG
jgi:hypothetical protein